MGSLGQHPHGDRSLREWIDLVADLLQRPQPRFPRREVAGTLMDTFDVRVVSWGWRDRSGRTGFQSWPHIDLARLPPPSEHRKLISRHPLVRWFTTTGDPRAQTTGRVPTSISPLDERRPIEEYLKPLACEQQLAVPYAFEGLRYEAFVLGRPGDDFTERDLELAGALQRVIRGLYLHTGPVATTGARATYAAPSTHLGLTATECAVLALLTAGHTTYSIALRLEMAPRTASKHLEHIYRKLGVTNRVSAVLAAREAGLVDDAASRDGMPSSRT